jgi:hypothetical protein
MKLPTTKNNYQKTEMEEFKKQMLEEMRKMGATQDDFEMFADEELLNDIVMTAMLNKQEPKDVAWAVMQ